MPPRRPSQTPEEVDASVSYQLGQISGQLRELIHTGNNNAQKLDALGIRVGALENERGRRDGERGVWQAILQSPFVAWALLAVGAIWAAITGKLHA